jgi:hypothetical protein
MLLAKHIKLFSRVEEISSDMGMHNPGTSFLDGLLHHSHNFSFFLLTDKIFNPLVMLGI